MKIARATCHPIWLPLARPLASARGVLRVRTSVLLRLETADGRVGWGEAAPLPDYGTETVARCAAALAEAVPALLGSDPRDADVAAVAGTRAADAPAARAALDAAALDLRARLRDVAIAALLAGGRAPRAAVPVNALVAAGSPDEAADAVAARAATHVAAGFAAVKLKIGAGPLARDVERVRAVRAAIGDGISLRLDANGALTPETALALVRAIEPARVEWIEQPLPERALAETARLRRASPIALAADESLRCERDLEALIDARAVDVVIVKPSAVGGPSVATRMAQRAREAGLGVSVSTLLEGAVGRAAALQLAASLPAPLPACGLATADWLAADVADDPVLAGGALRLPAGPGLGVTPDGERLAALAALDVMPADAAPLRPGSAA